MGAAAVALHIRHPVTARGERTGHCGLAFDMPGGPLVAVCGLVGGAGASTLALCLAQQAARESAAPILLTESATERGGLAVIAGRASHHSLWALAEQVAADGPPSNTFVELDAGLRLVAAAPSSSPPVSGDSVQEVLGQAREVHGLVVVDCGTDWRADGPILAGATHIIWALPATAAGLARARLLLDSAALPRPGRWREVLAATSPASRTSASVRALRRLAKQRCDRLVLLPHDEAVAAGDMAAGASLMRALTGLASTLRSHA